MRRMEGLVALSIVASLHALACNEQPDKGSLPNGAAPCIAGSVGCSTPAPAGMPSTAGTGNTIARSAAGTAALPSTSGAAAPIATAGAAAPPTVAEDMGGVPCDVAKLVSDHCTLCHATKPQAGAPMPLMTLRDFQAQAKSNPAMTVAQLIATRVNATEQARLMPPVNSTAALMPAEKTTLTTWTSAGAKGVTANACAITEPMKDPMMPATVGGMGGASLQAIEYNDPEMKCYKFLTHAQGNKDMPYQHGPGEEYVNFTFKAPWTGTVYTRAHKIVLGDAPILHHWLLYIDPSPGPDGGISGNSTGIHPSSNLLHAWAPGASPLYFDPDVGMKLDGTVGVTLEAHINNSTGATGSDHNGAEICVTTKVPAHVVDMTWTGSESIAGTSATGTCTPRSQMPIHIIAAQPHMHKKGIHMKVVINRANGMKEIMHDDDFMFDNQRYYIIDKVLMPGDTFTTTCTYSAPSTFGQYTNNEMCYFFPIAWPVGSMAGGAGIHGPTTCLR
jgi:hypothetical protein